MKFERLLGVGLAPRQDPADLVVWRRTDCVILNADGSVKFEQKGVEVPARWSDHAASILADKYLRKAGVPLGALDGIEEDLPTWLWRRAADPGVPTGGETSARQIFHRLAGCWTYHAWKNGYFEGCLPDGYVPTAADRQRSEADAHAFYCECYLSLAQQLAAPNSPQWFNTGLHWAYGIEGGAAGQWAIDYDYVKGLTLERRTDFPPDKLVYQTTNAYEHPQPHACFIQPIDDDLVNEGGIMDLWVREARLFKFGSGTGTNFSRLRGKGEKLSGGGRASGLMSWLGIGDRAAGAIQSGGTTRRAAKMVICDLDHPEVEDFIDWKVREEQKAAAMYVGSQVIHNHQVSTSGGDLRVAIPPAIVDRVKNGAPAEIYGVGWEEEARESVSGQNSNNSVRVTNEFLRRVDAGGSWDLTARVDGKTVKTVSAAQLWNKVSRAAWACGDPGVQFHDTINEWHTCPNDGEIVASNPCSEYMFLDDTACNLASLNLGAFLRDDGSLDLDLYQHLVRLWTVVLDVSVQMASFPSREIAIGTYKYRTLGLGPANVGGLLMRSGLPYDSDEGRALAAAMQALMTGVAYRTSAELARELGPFPRWEANADPMRRVLRNHARAAHLTNADGRITKDYGWEGLSVIPPTIPAEHVAPELCDAIREAWIAVLRAGSFRNAQVTVAAPTGTISFVMDCDMTGIEPEFAMVKYKNLAGGGTMRIVNPAIKPALLKMGASPEAVAEIVTYVDAYGTVEGCPTFGNGQDISVFDCSNPARPGGRFLRPMAHVLMVAALQPFLSGAASKTINLPNDATVADVDLTYREAHRLGVKSVALFRDGCKLTQPLNVGKTEEVDTSETLRMPQPTPDQVEYLRDLYKQHRPAAMILDVLPRGAPERLPWRRDRGYTQKAVIGDQTLFWRVSEYPDGRPGEIFIELAHEGSTLRATANSLAMAMSIGLQRGVPVEKYVDLFLGVKFEPAGYVEGHERVRFASSYMDLIVKDLAITYLGRDDLAQTEQTEEHPALRAVGAAPAPRLTGDACPACGSLLVRTGTCRSCTNCPYNEGCG